MCPVTDGFKGDGNMSEDMECKQSSIIIFMIPEEQKKDDNL